MLTIKMPNTVKPLFDTNDTKILTEEFAISEDEKDPLRKLRDEFIIPTKNDLKNTHYGPAAQCKESNGVSAGSEPSIYLCGNSLGLQPRRTRFTIRFSMYTVL
jgi:kynureninase